MGMLEAGSIIAGKYRLDRPLARGGMGSVWLARHLQLDIDIAMKFMAQELASSAEARRRFEREARASAQLRSPHVVQMYDYGAEGDTLFLAMELLHGEDLDARLRQTPRLPLAEVGRVVDQVCKALECAHDANVVHRDLKPANLFLARQGREEIVKVLDFGIAKATGPVAVSSATKTGTLVGSPHYMSPEQVRRSKDVDPRSDLWSLGIIIYQCLTGRVPFAGEELGDVLVAICSDDYPPPSQLVPALGPEVDAFLARALTRKVDQRFQSARELASTFAALVQRVSLAPATAAEAMATNPGLARDANASHPVVGAVTPVATAALAMPQAQHAVAAPIGSAPVLPSGTLAPSGGTLAMGPSQKRPVVLIASLVASVVLGLLGVIVIWARSREAPPVVQTDRAAALDGAPTTPEPPPQVSAAPAPPPAVTPEPTASATPPAETTATATAAASTSPKAPRATLPASPKNAGKARPQSPDLLEHRR